MVNWVVPSQTWTCGQLRKSAQGTMLLRLICKALTAAKTSLSGEGVLGHTEEGYRAITSAWTIRGVLVSKTNLEKTVPWKSCF